MVTEMSSPAKQRLQARSLLDKIKRITNYRLIVPIKRGKSDPKVMARGVALGIAAALTPLVGIQMLIVTAIWIVQKALFPQWKFNVFVALAWTWATNIITLPFVYYVFLLTGNLMLGRYKSHGSFDTFFNQFNVVLSQNLGFWESLWVQTEIIFIRWGEPMFIGCLPWLILGSWLGYVWCLKFMENREKRRLRRALLAKQKLPKSPKS